MASRRLAAFADQYLRYMLQSRLAEQQAEAVSSRQERTNAAQDTRQLRQLALADPTGRIASLTGQTQYQPSGRSILGQRLGKNISDAKTLGDLPSDTDLRSQGARELEIGGHDPSGAVQSFTGSHLPMESVASPSVDGSLPSRSLRPTERPDIKELLAQNAAKRSAITSTYDFEDTRKIATEGGMVHERNRMGNQDANEFLPDVLKRASAGAQQTDADRLRTLTNVGPAEARQAGRVSGSQAGASTAARINTEFANKDKLGDIARAQQLPTQGENKVAGQLGPLTQAHSNLLQMENAGGGLAGGVLNVMGSPVLMNTVGNRIYSPEDLQFGQAANEWGNIAGYIISGVAVREDERGNFIAAFVANKNDPPELKLKKKAAREAFIQAGMMSSGAAGDSAGRALAQAIKSGKVDAGIMNTLQFTNPETLQGFTAEMTSLPTR